MKSIRMALVMTATALMVSAGALEAQRGPQNRRGGPDREQLERRIRAQMGRMMAERLGLTEQQAEDLAEVVLLFERARRELAMQERATRQRVEALLLDGGSEGEAAELLARLAELRTEEATLFVEEQEALLEILTPEQVLGVHVFREQMGERIRRIRGERGSRGDGPPGRRRGRGGS